MKWACQFPEREFNFLQFQKVLPLFFFFHSMNVTSAVASTFSENIVVLSVGRGCYLLQASSASKNLGRVRFWGSLVGALAGSGFEGAWCMSTVSLDCAVVVWRLESVGGV